LAADVIGTVERASQPRPCRARKGGKAPERAERRVCGRLLARIASHPGAGAAAAGKQLHDAHDVRGLVRRRFLQPRVDTDAVCLGPPGAANQRPGAPEPPPARAPTFHGGAAQLAGGRVQRGRGLRERLGDRAARVVIAIAVAVHVSLARIAAGAGAAAAPGRRRKAGRDAGRRQVAPGGRRGAQPRRLDQAHQAQRVADACAPAWAPSSV